MYTFLFYSFGYFFIALPLGSVSCFMIFDKLLLCWSTDQVYNWEIWHHSTVCRCGLADILQSVGAQNKGIAGFQCYAIQNQDQNKNQNRSKDNVSENLGNKRRYIHEDPRQDWSQRNISYTRYPKKCFTQSYRDLGSIVF